MTWQHDQQIRAVIAGHAAQVGEHAVDALAVTARDPCQREVDGVVAPPGVGDQFPVAAQPDEQPPYPVRTAFQRCLGDSTDIVLVRHVEAFVTANPSASHGPMITVVMRALFDLCRAEISKIRPPTPQVR